MVVAPLVRSGRLASRALRTAASTSAASSSTASSSNSRRNLHTCPPTPELLSEGCAPFLSASTVKQISQRWQGGLLDLLNQEVRDTEFASSSIVETVIGLSQNREKILAFNYASQALNNSFFLSTLAPQDRLRNPTPLPKLATAISKSFGSFPEMCLAFSSAAYGMAGSGWVWLVTDQHRNLGVVPTFGSGTVIVQNRLQQGKHFLLPSINDQSTGSPDTAKNNTLSSSSPSERPSRPADSLFGGLGISDKVGKEIYPLLNISVHEHAWLNDYGIMGKEEYLTRFWNCVNWDKVEERFESYCPQSSRYL
ncbi:related to Superoxide dismutase [Ustilago trichophora]|uniref:Related to Superoxide dismutase n=1 Tax=Ustilago trichophora TaxID=86804 RepID=A0A5C3ERL1_9BASI|nr:related to Superoxide dismutase [Ustilago trichophora]